MSRHSVLTDFFTTTRQSVLCSMSPNSVDAEEVPESLKFACSLFRGWFQKLQSDEHRQLIFTSLGNCVLTAANISWTLHLWIDCSNEALNADIHVFDGHFGFKSTCNHCTFESCSSMKLCTKLTENLFWTMWRIQVIQNFDIVVAITPVVVCQNIILYSAKKILRLCSCFWLHSLLRVKSRRTLSKKFLGTPISDEHSQARTDERAEIAPPRCSTDVCEDYVATVYSFTVNASRTERGSYTSFWA